jgi:hypothetical protein
VHPPGAPRWSCGRRVLEPERVAVLDAPEAPGLAPEASRLSARAATGTTPVVKSGEVVRGAPCRAEDCGSALSLPRAIRELAD